MTRSHWTRSAALAALLAIAPLAIGGAAAQDRSGQGRQAGPPDRFDIDRVGAEAFDRGYRAGREEERRRGRREADSAGAQSSFGGLAWNDPAQGEARERLERAAAELRRALALMDRQAFTQRLREALAQARQALIRTQDAMTWLPPGIGPDGEPDYPRRSGRGIGAENASGGWAG